jgi:hypothetical protein
MPAKAATNDDERARGGLPSLSTATVSADSAYSKRCPDKVAKKLASGVP